MSRTTIAVSAGACLVIGTLVMVAATSKAEQHMALVFWTLSTLIILIGIISEAGGIAERGRDSHPEVVINNYAPAQPQPQPVQYVPYPVYEPAAPQIVYVEKEAPPPQIVYVEREAAQLPQPEPAKLSRIFARTKRQPHISAPHCDVEVLPPGWSRETAKAVPPPRDEPLRLSGPKKGIASRVAVALLSKPKGRERS